MSDELSTAIAEQRPHAKKRIARAARDLGVFFAEFRPPVEIEEWKDRVLSAAGLTEKQREVTELLLKGFTDKQISETTGNTVKTIKHHLGVVREKFDVDSRAELFATIFGMLG